jgi:hypothetical protein
MEPAMAVNVILVNDGGVHVVHLRSPDGLNFRLVCTPAQVEAGCMDILALFPPELGSVVDIPPLLAVAWRDQLQACAVPDDQLDESPRTRVQITPGMAEMLWRAGVTSTNQCWHRLTARELVLLGYHLGSSTEGLPEINEGLAPDGDCLVVAVPDDTSGVPERTVGGVPRYEPGHQAGAAGRAVLG